MRAAGYEWPVGFDASWERPRGSLPGCGVKYGGTLAVSVIASLAAYPLIAADAATATIEKC